MEEILTVRGLCKKYPAFSLKDVTFSVKPGQIMGFIGRNGAGKTTTLKSIMNLVHYDSGYIAAFDREMNRFELENKQRIGFALSELNYYPNRTIKNLSDVTKRFYRDFDEARFAEICRMFNLDTGKKLEELSSGMKVTYSVVTALSHKAELLILDEPTSGLDPVSRDEILDIFREIVKDGKRAILFSTHITS
ncbi:MAG: ABC transporter ATP-binding protein, partial [Clostridia bacterium]|nr:ABC transporter ATP-binding protein [Clostridia bacterium]